MTTLRAFLKGVIVAFVMIGPWPVVPCVWVQASRANPNLRGLGNAVSSDFKYLADNVEADGEDIKPAPLHRDAAGAFLTDPWFYLAAGGARAAFDGSFALDQTIRSHLHDMWWSSASTRQGISYGSVGAAVGLLYGSGRYVGDPRTRQYALTAGEGAGAPPTSSFRRRSVKMSLQLSSTAFKEALKFLPPTHAMAKMLLRDWCGRVRRKQLAVSCLSSTILTLRTQPPRR